MEAVGELDEDDPQVASHGHEHLAEVAGLVLGAAGEVEALELGHAVHNYGDRAAEPPTDVLDLDLFVVLNGVVEEGGDDAGRIGFNRGEDQGNGEGVVYVGLAGQPALSAMGFVGEVIGREDQVGVQVRPVRSEPLDYRVDGTSHDASPTRRWGGSLPHAPDPRGRGNRVSACGRLRQQVG